jgi:restriction endonuclease fold toxin 2 of polymorphic toxin system
VTGTGYAVDPDTIFRCSLPFLDSKQYCFDIASGTVGDLAASSGMAGNDDAGRNFAAKYEPAARAVIDAIDKSGVAMAAISGRLLTMAWNYLKQEDAVAAAFNGGQIDTSSAMTNPPECEPSGAAAGLPSVTSAGQSSGIPIVGKFWPQGNPDQLRAAAQVWTKAGELIDDAQANAYFQCAPIIEFCKGDAIDAFLAYKATVFTAPPSGGTAVGPTQALMENISAACRLLANACNSYASAIDGVRNTITDLAVGAGIITVGGIILSIFTLGGSDAAAGAGDGALAAEAATAADAMVTAEATSAEAAAIAEAEQIVADAAASLNVEVAAASTPSAIPGVGLMSAVTGPAAAGTTGTSGFLTAVGTGASAVGPIPPQNPPAFPLYSPEQQAAAQTWANGLPQRPPNYGTPDDRAYQTRVAGAPERLMPGADGSTVWADGFRPADGAAIDAKNVRQLGCSARTLDSPWTVSNSKTASPRQFNFPRTTTSSVAINRRLTIPQTTSNSSKWTPTILKPSVTGSSSVPSSTSRVMYAMRHELPSLNW